MVSEFPVSFTACISLISLNITSDALAFFMQALLLGQCHTASTSATLEITETTKKLVPRC